MPSKTDGFARGATLGKHLANLRLAAGLTLRQVEEATEKEVSNAYLSQLETGKITKPSPNVLHALSQVYKAGYQDLMELAGYITTGHNGKSEERHGRVPALAIENLTPEEEEKILEYLAFLRLKRKRSKSGENGRR